MKIRCGFGTLILKEQKNSTRIINTVLISITVLKSGHIGSAIILSIIPAGIISVIYGVQYGLLLVSATGYLSGIPDLDSSLPDISTSVLGESITTSHRGITHTIYFSILFGIILSFISVLTSPLINVPIPVAFLCGFLSVTYHVFSDTFTPMGINFIPPLTSNISFERFYYDNLFVNLICFTVGLISLFILLGAYYIGILTVLYYWTIGILANVILLSILYYADNIDERCTDYDINV